MQRWQRLLAHEIPLSEEALIQDHQSEKTQSSIHNKHKLSSISAMTFYSKILVVTRTYGEEKNSKRKITF